MIFYGNGLVWNPNTNSAVRFIDGVCETTDPVKIDFLIARGYKHDGEVPKAAEPEPTPVKRRNTTKKGQA